MKGSKPQVPAHTDPQADRLTHARHRERAARRFSLFMDNAGHPAPGSLTFTAGGTASGAGVRRGTHRVTARRTS